MGYIELDIDSKNISNIAKDLISKLSSSIGWIISLEKSLNDSVVLIENETQSMLSHTNSISLEYKNQCKIFMLAVKDLENDAPINKIDIDWIAFFFDRARLIYDNESQKIWGKILSRQINQPNSIPKSLIDTLTYMDKEDRIAFTKLVSFSIYTKSRDGKTKTFFPVIDERSLREYYKDHGLYYNSLVNLAAYGLIEMDMGSFSSEYYITEKRRPLKIYYYDKLYEINKTIDDNDNILIGSVVYTKTGQALCQAIEVQEVDDFYEKICSKKWE